MKQLKAIKNQSPPNTDNRRLELREDQMRRAGYKVIDTIIDHQLSLDQKFPVAIASRNEMDILLEEPMPEDGLSIERFWT
ncbi:MAG: hypothetical protein KJO00_02250, partial [Bacteroidia bacterium]|nr:hypothetical protein [Bacteroidia bacterium]